MSTYTTLKEDFSGLVREHGTGDESRSTLHTLLVTLLKSPTKADTILAEYGADLLKIADAATRGVLSIVPRVTEDDEVTLLAALQLGLHYTHQDRRKGDPIYGPDDVATRMAWMRTLKAEQVVCIALDTKNCIIGQRTIFQGTLDTSIVHPRDIFRFAIQVNARAVMLVHNHPSGDPRPSYEDSKITKRIAFAGTAIGIQLLDHIIIGDHYYSFKENDPSALSGKEVTA